MIPFEELCAALERHRRQTSGEPEPAAYDERQHAAPSEPTRMDMDAPSLDEHPDTTGEIDLGDVVEE